MERRFGEAFEETFSIYLRKRTTRNKLPKQKFSCTDILRAMQFSCTKTTDIYVHSEEHAKNRAVLIKKSDGTILLLELSA